MSPVEEKYRQHEKDFEDSIKVDPNAKDFFEQMKPFHYPDYFPAVLDIRVAGNKIHAVTYKNENHKNECFIFEIKGKLLKKTFLNLHKMDANSHYPFDIKNGKVYQLLETEDMEGWNLHVTEVN